MTDSCCDKGVLLGGGVEPSTEFKGGMWASGKLLGMGNRKGNGDNKLQNGCKDNGIQENLMFHHEILVQESKYLGKLALLGCATSLQSTSFLASFITSSC